MPGTFYLTKCENCGLVFQNPRVKEEQIHLFYKDSLGYYNPPQSQIEKIENEDWLVRFKKYLYRQILVNHFGYTNFGNPHFLFKILTFPGKRRLKISLMPKYVQGGRLLEIGCSYGGRLEALKKLGWEVKGIEMDRKSSEHALRAKKLNVENKRIEEVDFQSGTFDVILMSMVLEHLYSPFELLKKVTKWLKPDGQLIFSIPYFEGIEFQIFKEYTYALQLPHHITFFNRTILNEYLRTLGFTKIKFYFQAFDRDIVASAHYKYQSTKNLAYKFIAYNKVIRKVIIKPLVFFLSLIGKTSRVTIYAEKANLSEVIHDLGQTG